MLHVSAPPRNPYTCWSIIPEKIEHSLNERKKHHAIGKKTIPPSAKSDGPSLRYLLHKSKMGFVPERNEFHTAFTCKMLVKNKHLRPFSTLTDMSVVPRLLYTGTKGRPERVFRSGMKTSINSFRNESFRIILLWYYVTTGMNSFLNKTHSDIM